MTSTVDLSPPPASPRGGVYAWAVVGLLFLTAIVSYTDRQVLSLLVDPIRRDLAVSDTEVSLLLGTAFAVVYGVAGVPLGWLADRRSRRNLIVAGVVVWSLATIACGLSRTFGEMFASRLFVGLGEAVLSPAAISLISDYFPENRRGLAVGVFLSGIAMGSGFALFIGGAALRLVEAGGVGPALAPWRLLLLALGAPGLAWAGLLLVIREPARSAGSGEAKGADGTPAVAALLRAAPIFAFVAAASLVDNAVGAWSPSLLIRRFHQDPAQIGIELGLLLTAGFGAGVLGGGWIADRAGAIGGLSAKLKACAVPAGLILLAALGVNDARFPVAMASVPVYFALSGVVTAIGFSAILDVTPNRARGLAMSVSFFLNVAVGAGVGPTAVALAQARVFGPGAGLGPPLAATMICGYALGLAAIAAAWLLRERAPAPRAAR